MKTSLFLVFIFLVSLILHVGCSGLDDTNITKSTTNTVTPKVGNRPFQMAPDFQLSDLEGNVVTLIDFRGSPVVVHFWRIN